MPLPPAPQRTPPPRTPERIAVDVAVRLSVLAVFAYVAWTLVEPFIPVMLWSAVLTVALYPVYERLRAAFGGRPAPAALVVTLLCIAVTAGPAMLLVSSLVRTVEATAAHVGGPPYDLPPLPHEITDLPVVGPQIAGSWALASSNIEALFARFSHVLIGAGEWALHLTAGIGWSVGTLFVAMLVAGFLYGPAPRLVATIHDAARHVIGARGSDFVLLAGSTIRTVARGVIGVALIQTLLVGFALVVAEVPGAGLLALATLMLCILQIGALPVVVPIVVWAWIVRDTGGALFLTAWLIPAALSDNLLKPLLMAKGLTTPIVVILVGVVGGTLAYGLTGLFLGPVVLAVFYDLVRFWLSTPAVAPPGGSA